MAETTPTPTPTPAPPAEPKLSRDDLIERSRDLFEVAPHVMVGALAMAPSNQKEFTVAAVSKLIDKFRKNEVS